MKISRPVRLSLTGILVVVAAYFIFLFAYGWVTDWEPEQQSKLEPEKSLPPVLLTDSVYRFVIWNVGFGGLGAESDFFYDDQGMWYSGSSMVRSPRPLVEKNLRGALDFFGKKEADFYLLQEVDVNSDRSYRIDQYTEYGKALDNYCSTLALNYICPRVPIPLLEPWHAYGKVVSGLGTFSRWSPEEALREQLPGHYPMPDRMFQLDRCVTIQRYPTNRGKDLVVINLHNAAYDPGDKIKAIQLPHLRAIAQQEYEKGNYVVLGGDWNQCPPYFRFDTFMPGNSQGYQQGNIPDDFFPEDWHFAYDPTKPTNRKTRDPYQKGSTFVTIIDYYLVSPNVRIKKVKTEDLDFQFSDHQPVYLEIELL